MPKTETTIDATNTTTAGTTTDTTAGTSATALTAAQLRWIARGSKDSGAAMLAQGGYSIPLAQKHASPLGRFGFGQDKIDLMVSWYTRLGERLGSRQAAMSDCKLAARQEVEAVSYAKDHIFLVRELLPMTLRDKGTTHALPSDIAPKGSLKRSAPKILEYLKATRELVARYENDLRPAFQGRSPLEAHDEAIAKLEAASGNQEMKLGSLPQETKAIYEAKGALLELIEDMNRVARVAFRGQAEIAAQFNKDKLLRTRRGIREEASTTDTPPSPFSLDESE
jgi:hypothetical protein